MNKTLQDKHSNKKLVCVLGMHRSGTSALSKLIIQLGFSAGDNLIPPDEDNEEGYFEDIDIYRINQNILSFLFLSWDRTEDFHWRKINYLLDVVWEKYGEKAINTLKSKLRKENQLLIKDPRFSILVPFWKKVFDQTEATVFFVLSVRNPLDVAKSLEKRNNFSFEHSFSLWNYYYASCLKDLQEEVHVVHFEDLYDFPDQQLKSLADFLKIKKNSVLTEKTNAINSNIIHHKTPKKNQEQELNNYPIIISLYQYLNSEKRLKGIPIDILNKNYRNKKINQEVLTSSLFLSKLEDGKLSENQLTQSKHKSGDVTLLFGQNSNNEFHEFNLFLCDKKCVVLIKNIEITTLSEKHRIKKIKSNALFQKEDFFLFANNTPEIKFSIENPQIIRNVKVECSICTEPETIAGLIIPIQNYISWDGKRNQLLKETESDIPPEKISVIQTTALFCNESRRVTFLVRQTDNQKKIIESLRKKINKAAFENIELEKQKKIIQTKLEESEKSKEHLIQLINESENRTIQLQNDFYSMQKSLSWKLTIPVRFAGKVTYSVFPSIRIVKEIFLAGAGILKNEGVYNLFRKIKDGSLKKKMDEPQPHQKPVKTDTTKKINVPVFDIPVVSIIIPVFNQWEYTYRCIRSIVDHTVGVTYEIIVGDDVSTDKTKDIKKIIKNITVIRNKENLKFVRNNNNAARYAKGKFLLFLNNDTEVHKNWLKPLMDVFKNHKNIGIVGAKLVYPDLKLQEAGGIIWNNGSGWNYGRYDNPDKPEYNYLRETDYVSGACLMIEAELWQKLNGFDEHFVPAYYEDTDLAFRVREAGYKVMYQPQSVVTHFEGISNGKELTEGLKKYQVRNAKKFSERWGEILLEENFSNGQDVFLAKDRSKNKKQVLVIDHYVPHFDQDAGSRSTFSYIVLLVKMGCKVTFIGDNFYKHEPYTTILQQKGVEILYGNDYCQNIHQWLKENGKYFTHIFMHRMHIAPKYLDTVKKYSAAKLIYIGHDLQFISSQRKYERTKDPGHLTDSEKFKTIETKLFNTVDVICPFSTYEAPFIREIVPHKQIVTLPVYFFEKVYENTIGFEQRKDILFVGGFAHPPNKDAVLWFVNEVFPLIKKQIKDVRLHVVGSKPPAEVKALANDSIHVTGFVPDDELERYYQSCRISVIPLRYGAGVKGKLIETCYYQLPPVITPVAAEGVFDIEKYCVIEDIPEEYAKKVVKLYENKIHWEQQTQKCKELIANNFTERAAQSLIFERIFI